MRGRLWVGELVGSRFFDPSLYIINSINGIRRINYFKRRLGYRDTDLFQVVILVIV